MASAPGGAGEPGQRSGVRLIRASGWLFVGSVAGGAISYAYQILVGRLLSPEEYGTLIAMMAVFAIVGVPLTAASMVIAREITRQLALGDVRRVRAAYRRAWLYCGTAAATCLALTAATALLVKGDSGFAATWTVAAFGIMVAITVFTPVYTGFLQGIQHPFSLSLSTIAGHAGKTLFGTLLILAGWGVAGAFAGIALSNALVLVVIAAVIMRMQRRLAADSAAERPRGAGGHSAVLPFFVASLSFAMLSQLDVAIVKAYYSPADAGAYAAASMLGRAIMYLPGALVVAMFPMVVENEALERSSLHLLVQGLAITAAVSGAGTLFYFVTGEWLIRLFYGSAYGGAGEVLRLYGLAMMPMAMIMVLEHFLLAKGRAFFAYLLLVAAPVQWALIAAFHEHLVDAVWIVAGTAWALLILGVLALSLLSRAASRPR